MDSKYIQNEHIVDRYLAGDLKVREAREFEKYCLEHPQILKTLPIPVRLKARLARHPVSDSETAAFQAIPSSTTRAAIAVGDDGFDLAEEEEELKRTYGDSGGTSRYVVFGLVFALLAAAAAAGLIAYGMHASSLTERMQAMQRDLKAKQMQAPGSVLVQRVQLSRVKPEQVTLAIGWPQPPQLLDLRVDVSEGKYTNFQITIDKADGVRVMQLHRVARDSNREVRLGLNSSSFGPGDYLLRFDGYDWRGQTEEVGWLRLGLE